MEQVKMLQDKLCRTRRELRTTRRRLHTRDRTLVKLQEKIRSMEIEDNEMLTDKFTSEFIELTWNTY